MSKERTSSSITGFCNADPSAKSHGNCKHVYNFSMGIYSQWTCQCSCHPAGPANIERGAK